MCHSVRYMIDLPNLFSFAIATLGEIEPESFTLRIGQRSISCFIDPALPQRVPELMGDLFAWLKKSKDHLLIRSCVFHYEFEFIHPFSDGNGRTGRLWQSLIFGRLNPLFEHLPVENMVYANQQEYYNAIAASTSEGHSGPFIDFMLNEILKTLQKNIKEVVPNKVPNKSELSILRLLADNPRLTRIELAEKVGITENGVKKIIANMKTSGWIERMGSNKTGYWIVQYELI